MIKIIISHIYINFYHKNKIQSDYDINLMLLSRGSDIFFLIKAINLYHIKKEVKICL